MAQHVFDARHEPRRGSGHFQEYDAVLETTITDVATVLGRGRLDTCVDQFLNLGRNFRVGIRILGQVSLLHLYSRSVKDNRLAGDEVVHDGAEDDGLQQFPVLVVRF